MSQQCKTVLIFNARKKLVCICASVYEASKITHCKAGNISRVCTGELISNGNLYFRYIPNDITVTILDLNRLNLEDYDKICGVDRKVYKTQRMNRKRWKYNCSVDKLKTETVCIQ